MHVATQRLLFGASSRLTEVFPSLGARLLDATLRPTLGSEALIARFERRNRATMLRVRAFRRFLVLPDIHIGDAVLTQPALTAIRDFFPHAEIDYAVNRAMVPVVDGNPDATRVIPLFSGGAQPSATDVAALRALIREGRYDLCLSFTSLLEPEEQADPQQPLVSVMTHGATIIRDEGDPTRINHFSFQDYRFVRGLLGMVARPVRAEAFPGLRTTFSDQAIEGARAFADGLGLPSGAPVVILNPDGASPYARVPFDQQQTLLARLARDRPPEAAILVGEGHTEDGIGRRLVEALPAALRGRIHLIPQQLPLASYAALLDLADLFVTGDTGPLHLAAARRHSRNGTHRFRNRTAIVSIFGATLPRMSGYDSSRPGFLHSSQDAPSWCFHERAPCHNITCLNKLYKTCRAVRCFERLDLDAVARVAVAHIANVAARPAARPAAPQGILA